MIKNYLKLAFRHLIRKKTFSIINIFGLTIGLVSCILIGLFISDEWSFDSFHPRASRIARVTMEYSKGVSSTGTAVTGTKVGPQFKKMFPEVEEYTRTFLGGAIVSIGASQFSEKKFLYADSSFFRFFSFPLVNGDPYALNNKRNIVLTASTAQKYFGSADPIGKTLRVGTDALYRVGAIVADPPGNSQLQFDFVVGFENLGLTEEEWWSANYITYLLLKDPGEFTGLERRINAYMGTPAVRSELGLQGSDQLLYHLEPLTRVHLYSSLEGFTPNGSIVSIYVLTIIAILILTIACFNYTNLAIAQSANRTGEIGIRKVLGAQKTQLFTQFSGESLLITFIALSLAVFISIQLLPAFNELSGKQLNASALLQAGPFMLIVLTGMFIGLVAGAYPALILANTRLIHILRSGFRITGGHGGLRRSLIVIQFVISLFLIITTVVILQQMSYIRHKNLGFDRDHVLVMPLSYRVLNRYEALRTAILQLPGTVRVSGSYNLPVSASWGDGLTANNGREEVRMAITAIPAGLDFVPTMEMQLIAGSDFTPADLPATTGKDSANPRYSFILNETAVKKIGWTAQEALGKTVSGGKTGIVKGVVRDFHFASMHQPIGPLMIFLDTSNIRNMLIRVGGAQLPVQIDRLAATWKKFVPERPFEYHFLDEDYNSLYQTEQRTAHLFSLFSGLAILLALLGLFGLAAITTLQRTREIGIRKVLGAGLLNISLLIAKNFMVLVSIAFCIAVPFAWVASAKWLNGFSYRIPLPLWAFPLAGAAVLVVAFATVSFHAIRAARMNPAESLHSE